MNGYIPTYALAKQFWKGMFVGSIVSLLFEAVLRWFAP